MSNVKQVLEQAYAQIPTTFAYREAKFYLYHAIQKLKAVEIKEAKRDALNAEQLKREEEKRQMYRPMTPVGMDAVRETLSVLDDMIRIENDKINEIQQKKARNTTIPNERNDDEDLQTLHG